MEQHWQRMTVPAPDLPPPTLVGGVLAPAAPPQPAAAEEEEKPVVVEEMEGLRTLTRRARQGTIACLTGTVT